MTRYRASDNVAAFRSLPPEEQERIARLLADEQAGGQAGDDDREETVTRRKQRHHDTWIWRELDRRNWSARYLGRQLSVSYTHAARLANEEQPLTPDMCKRLAVIFEMTEGDVLRRAGHLSPLPDGYSALDEQRLVELYRALDLENRGQLTRFAEFLVADHQEPG